MWYFFNSRYQGESAMAPQRQRKLGLTRMDAAIDAMLPYGFAKSHVRKIVKRLLKEYGGNEGWPFIEEFAYKQLIEAILRDLGASDETAAENVNPSQVELKEEDIAEPLVLPKIVLFEELNCFMVRQIVHHRELTREVSNWVNPLGKIGG